MKKQAKGTIFLTTVLFFYLLGDSPTKADNVLFPAPSSISTWAQAYSTNEKNYTAGPGITISEKNEISISNVMGKNSSSFYPADSDDTNFIIGNDSTVQGDHAIVFGSGVKKHTTSANFIHIGNQSHDTVNEDNCNYAISIGDDSRANADSVVVIGQNAYSEGNHSVALGTYTFSNAERAVALGFSSTTNESDIVSVGHKKGDSYMAKGQYGPFLYTFSDDYYRRVVNVSDGIDDHDAATVGQLKAMLADSSADPTNPIVQTTNKLTRSINEQQTAITSVNNKIGDVSTSVENVRQNISNLNHTVASTITDLSETMGDFINKDMTNLSEEGKNVLKNLIQHEMASRTSQTNTSSAISIQSREKSISPSLSDTTPSTALSVLSEKVDTKADKNYVDAKLAKKADQSTVDAIAMNVESNTKSIASSTEAIKTNAEGIKNLQETKANTDGSNIDITSWSEKLGTGTIAKDNKSLVTGGTVFNALTQKADLTYVNSSLEGLENRMELMDRNLTKDINNGAASASALAALKPLDYDSTDKLNFSIGFGHYKNANATALGVFYYANANAMFHIGATIGSSTPAINAGLSFKLGKGSIYAGISKADLVKDNMTLHQEAALQLETIMDQQDMLDKQSREIENQNKKIDEMEKILNELVKKQK